MFLKVQNPTHYDMDLKMFLLSVLLQQSGNSVILNMKLGHVWVFASKLNLMQLSYHTCSKIRSVSDDSHQ